MTMLPLSDLSALYASAAASRLYDEAITELQHAVQCAELATAAGESDALVAAALLHDVGHLLLDDQVGLDARPWSTTTSTRKPAPGTSPHGSGRR